MKVCNFDGKFVIMKENIKLRRNSNVTFKLMKKYVTLNLLNQCKYVISLFLVYIFS